MKKLVDFSKFSSVKIGGVCEVFVIENENEIPQDHVIIGGANNILLSSNPPKLAMLSQNFDYIKLNGEILEVGARTKSAKIYNFAKSNDIANYEFLKNIPGTLGGLIKMNAGLLGFSISDNLLEILTPNGWIGRENFAFSYRHSGIECAILAARFKISNGFSLSASNEFENKRKNQPNGASFGSCFTNPKGDFAGRLIEAVGLKGHIIGGAKFSEKHANFLINFNNATFDDAIVLINLAKLRVYENFGINLQTEVVIL
ncbi:UDP-N-acetylmuramate dehydrogenase [Campylobacter mucosalis]|uniref:UDP-N-acetylmuramate dehydrogenase n=1 Tax=Campylobacter mucosalis TaxID=202 RepID=UPI0014703A4C|nr:UDP-N-acetylmuramate dehydrogenase [Campylobacter mucosalis]